MWLQKYVGTNTRRKIVFIKVIEFLSFSGTKKFLETSKEFSKTDKDSTLEISDKEMIESCYWIISSSYLLHNRFRVRFNDKSINAFNAVIDWKLLQPITDTRVIAGISEFTLHTRYSQI